MSFVIFEDVFSMVSNGAFVGSLALSSNPPILFGGSMAWGVPVFMVLRHYARAFAGGKYGKGQPPSKKSKFYGPDQKILSIPPDFRKNITLTFLKVTYPQITY